MSWWWRLLGCLLFVAIWVCASARITVRGLPTGVLESLARGKGLLTQSQAPWFDPIAWVAALPGDSLLWTAVLMTASTIGAAVVVVMVSQKIWKNSMSATLMLGFLFFGPNTLWALSTSPTESLEVFFLAGSIAAIISGSVPTLGGFVLATTALSPASGLALYPVLAYLCYKRERAYGIVVSSVTLFGVGCLLIPVAGNYRWEPSWSGLTVFSALPICMILFGRRQFSARTGTYASLLFGALLSGSAEWAAPIALADLAHYALNPTPEGAPVESVPTADGEKGWTLSVPLLAGILATVVLAFGVLKGEQALNREILIPAQKAKLPWSKLFGFFSLNHHAEKFTEESWRAKVPFPELTESDIEAARGLSNQKSSGFTVLTPSSTSESRRLSLLYALISERPLQGWDDPQHLAGALLLCKLRAKNFLSSGPELIFRGSDGRVSKPERPVREPTAGEQVDLSLGGALAMPFRVQTLSRDSGVSYQWRSSSEEYVLTFKDQPAEMVLTERVGKVTISSLQDPEVQRVFEIFPLKLELSGLPPNATWPSRSLVPLTLMLTNRGESAITSELLSKVFVETNAPESFGPFVQKISRQFILFPEEGTQLTLQLASPEPEGEFEIQISARTPLGEEFRIPLLGGGRFRTWRRLPPSPGNPVSPQTVEEP